MFVVISVLYMWHIIDKGRHNTVKENFFVDEEAYYCVIRTDQGDELVGERNMNGYTVPENRDICAFDFVAGDLMNCSMDNTVLYDPSVVLDIKPSVVQGDNPSYMRCEVQFQPNCNRDDLQAYMSKISPFLASSNSTDVSSSTPPPDSTTTTLMPTSTSTTPVPTTSPSTSDIIIDARDITGTLPIIFDTTTTETPASTTTLTPSTTTTTYTPSTSFQPITTAPPPTTTYMPLTTTQPPSTISPLTTAPPPTTTTTYMPFTAPPPTTTVSPPTTAPAPTTYRPMNTTTLSTVIETRAPSTTRLPFQQQPLPFGTMTTTNAPSPSTTTTMTKRPSSKTSKPPIGSKVNTPSSRITIVTSPPIMQTPGSNSALNLNIINKSSSGKSKGPWGRAGGAETNGSGGSSVRKKKRGSNSRYDDDEDDDDDDWEEFASWRRGGGCAGGCGGGGCCGAVCCGGGGGDSSSSSDSDDSSSEEEAPEYEWNGMDMPPVVLIDDQTWGWQDMGQPPLNASGIGLDGPTLASDPRVRDFMYVCGRDGPCDDELGKVGAPHQINPSTTDTTTPDASDADTKLDPAPVDTIEDTPKASESTTTTVTASELPEIPQDRSKWKYAIVAGKFTLNGTPLVLKGVNWHGFENQEFFPQPLWDISMETGFKELAKNGVNAVRVPVSGELMMNIGNPDLLLGGTIPKPPKFAKQTDINFDKDCEGKPMSVAFDKFLKLAYKYNMLVMIDLHVFKAAPPHNNDYSNASYEFAQELQGVMKKPISFPKATVKKLWADFAKYLLKYPHVFGADLKNEPHQPPWKDWSKAASEYGKAVLAENPHLFIVVEGVNEDESGWGGALSGVKDAPVDVGVPNKIIYSPHRYGPGLRDDIKETSEASWDKHFGYLSDSGHCLMMGEWGLGNKHDDYAFNKKLAAYMQKKGINGFYWTFSYSSGDTVNILKKGSTDTKLLTNEKSYELMDIAANKKATQLKFPS